MKLDCLLLIAEFWSIYQQDKKYCSQSTDGSGRHPKFGFAVISPVLLTTIFVLFQWWRTEFSLINKLVTLPLVICQMWPQYRIVKILYFGLIKQNIRWKIENEENKKNVSSLGKSK